MKQGDVFRFGTSDGGIAELQIQCLVKNLPTEQRDVLSMVDGCALVTCSRIDKTSMKWNRLYMYINKKKSLALLRFMENRDVVVTESDFPYFVDIEDDDDGKEIVYITNGFNHIQCKDEAMLTDLVSERARLEINFPELLPRALSDVEFLNKCKYSGDLAYSKNKGKYENISILILRHDG